MAKYFKSTLVETPDITAPAGDVARIYPYDGPLLDYGEDAGSPSVGIEYVARALLVSEACTTTLVAPSGIKRVGVPLIAGYNPIGAIEVHSVSTGTIWGIK
jgi:hypothetical protein